MDEIEPLLCNNLHKSGCQEPLYRNYRFCPLCGRPAAALRIPDLEDRIFSFVLSAQGPPKNIRLQNEGPGPLPVHAKLQGMGVSLLAQTVQLQSGSLDRPSTKFLQIRFETMGTGSALLTLSTEIEPQEEDPWLPRKVQDYQIRIRWREQKPGTLVILTPSLLFHMRGELRRPLSIVNDGDVAIPLILPALPPQFIFADVDPKHTEIAPGLPVTLIIEYHGLRLMTANSYDVYFESPAGPVPFRLLTEAAPPGGVRPDWIVAVDFGTSNTSIVARSISRGVQETCLALPGPDGSTRFPSAMFYRFEERRWLFGKEALEAAKAAGAASEGYLIDDDNSLKMSLSERHESYSTLSAVPGAGAAFTIANLLQIYLGYLKETVIEPFFREGPKVYIQYVLSLPVLDGVSGEKFLRHRERLTTSFARVFDVPVTQILTDLEPNCAANHFLIGQGYPHLKERLARTDSLFVPGDRFMVVDSGGGTTDIVFGEFSQGAPGLIPFNVLANLGLDENQEDFGGRKVNDFLHRALNTAALPDHLRDRYQHSPCEPCGIEHSEGGDFGRSCAVIAGEVETTLKPIYSQNKVPETMPEEFAAGLQQYAKRQMLALLKHLYAVYPAAFEKKLRWLFLVGGNSLVLAVEDTCSDRLAANQPNVMPLLPIEERYLAVAMGAAYINGLFLQDFSPYALTLILQSEQDQQTGNATTYVLQAKSSTVNDYTLPPTTYEGEVEIVLKADETILLSQRVGGVGQETGIEAKIIDGRVTLSIRDTISHTPNVLYESIL